MHLQVSKQFHAIINDPTLWRTLYADVRFPRPPGPLPWQSTKFLQQNLVHSARLSQCWTSQPMKIISRHPVPLGSAEEWGWVDGRWLILCTGMAQLVSHDVDTGSKYILYQSGDQFIQSWRATCCRMSTRGLLLYVVLHSGDKVHVLTFFRAHPITHRFLLQELAQVPYQR